MFQCHFHFRKSYPFDIGTIIVRRYSWTVNNWFSWSIYLNRRMNKREKRNITVFGQCATQNEDDITKQVPKSKSGKRRDKLRWIIYVALIEMRRLWIVRWNDADNRNCTLDRSMRRVEIVEKKQKKKAKTLWRLWRSCEGTCVFWQPHDILNQTHPQLEIVQQIKFVPISFSTIPRS